MQTSFKTTTLIAAIGMTITVGYYLAVQFINYELGIDLYVHPVRMSGLWRLHDGIWWLSVIIFFWGMFRYPNQLPKRTKWSKAIGIIVIVLMALSYVDRLWLLSVSDPQWLKCIHYGWRCLIRVGYLAGLWWCYAKCDNEPSPSAFRYIALITVIVSSVALLVFGYECLDWWFGPDYRWYSIYRIMPPFYQLIYIAVSFCVLLGIYDEKQTNPHALHDKSHIHLKRIINAGWILLGAFVIDILLLITVIVFSPMPEWIGITIMLIFLSIPLLSCIYMFIVSRALQKAWDIIISKQEKSEEQ